MSLSDETLTRLQTLLAANQDVLRERLARVGTPTQQEAASIGPSCRWRLIRTEKSPAPANRGGAAKRA